MHLWVGKAKGLDLLVQAVPPGSPSRKLLYAQLLKELRSEPPDSEQALSALAQPVLAELQRLVYVDVDGQPRWASGGAAV